MSERRSLEVSHGRGGAGNITPDSNVYVDGEIVREGTPSGAYSTGRGGGGNIHGPGQPTDEHDVVPEVSQRKAPTPTPGQGVSTGRGGGGNIVTDENGQEEHHGITDKVKEFFQKK